MVVEQAEGGAPEDIRGEPLLSVFILKGLLPVDGGEVQVAANRPARQETEEIAQVGPGLDVVELAAREQRHEGRVDVAAVVTADKQPILSLMARSA